jgi:hypothetical protein
VLIDSIQKIKFRNTLVKLSEFDLSNYFIPDLG